jgi:hypothetical protein
VENGLRGMAMGVQASLLEQQIQQADRVWRFDRAGHEASDSVDTFRLDRPIVVKRSDITLDFDGCKFILGNFADFLVLGHASLFPDPGLHFVTTGGVPGFRTRGSSGLSFRGTPFDLGPDKQPTGASNRPRGWGSLTQLQIDLRVRRNGPDWVYERDIVGIKGPENDTPKPFVIRVHPDYGIQLIFDLEGGGRVVASVPIADNAEVLEVHFKIDLVAGMVFGQQIGSGSSPIVGFSPHSRLVNRSPGHAILGAMQDNGHVISGPDLTFEGFRLSQSLGSYPASQSEWIDPLPDTIFTVNFGNVTSGFVEWRAGPSFRWGFGTLLADAFYQDTWRLANVGVKNLAVDRWGGISYGCGVRSFAIYGLTIRDCDFRLGAAGVALPFSHTNSHRVQVRDCYFHWQDAYGLWMDNVAQVVLENNHVVYPGRSAVLARRSNVSLEHLTAAGSQNAALESCDRVWRFEECPMVVCQDVKSNFEGSAPLHSYFSCSPSKEFDTAVQIMGCNAESPAGLAALVLEAAAISPTSRYQVDFGSFRNYSGIAVDAGQYWQQVL